MGMELFQIEQYVQMVLSYLRLEDMNGDLLIKPIDLDGIIPAGSEEVFPVFHREKAAAFL